MTEVIIYCLYALISSLLIICNIHIINRKLFNKRSLIKYFLYIFLSFILCSKNSQVINFLCLFVSFIYFRKDINKLLSFMISYIIMMIVLMISDTIVGFFITNILKIPYKEFLQSEFLSILSSTLILFISMLLSFLVSKFLNKINFNLENMYLTQTTQKWILTTISVFISLDILLRTFTLSSMDIIFDNKFYIYLICILILISFLILILYFLYKIIHISFQNNFIDKENKQLKEYTDMLEKMSSDLRKFKHDYVNILYTLGDFINNENIKDLKKYYNEELLPESKNIVTGDKHITLLKNIKVTPLKALVSSKLLTAQSQGIEINAEVLEEIDNLSIKTIDICRIIGIFLDNAIESAILCERKFIHFAMIKTPGNVIIVILNSCPENIPPIYQLYKKNFSTKGTNRGIGLTSVKELIDKSYDNILLNTSASSGTFKQELIIKEVISEL